MERQVSLAHPPYSDRKKVTVLLPRALQDAPCKQASLARLQGAQSACRLLSSSVPPNRTGVMWSTWRA